MENNPLKQYFRQPAIYVKLPSKGRWYDDGSVLVNEDGEVPIYPMSAIDDIMLNTPDAMLNGHALEKVITNCVPSVKDPKRLFLPDLEALFVGIKAATNNGVSDYDRKCPKCQHENNFELNCQALLDGTTFIDENDLTIKFGADLIVHVKPYDFEMRQMFIRREVEEEKTIRAIDAANETLDELGKAAVLAEGVDRLAQITFALVARSIEKVIMLRENITVIEPRHINEWLMEISKPQADIVIDAVNKLNSFGVIKNIPVQCTQCGHAWEDPISFDPTSFFGKRS